MVRIVVALVGCLGFVAPLTLAAQKGAAVAGAVINGAVQGYALGIGLENVKQQTAAIRQQMLVAAVGLRSQGVALGEDVPGVKYAIDFLHGEHAGRGYSLWVTLTYDQERAFSTGSGGAIRAARVAEHVWASCDPDKPRIGWLAQRAYDASGQATLSVDIPADYVLSDSPDPGSLDESILTAICQREGKLMRVADSLHRYITAAQFDSIEALLRRDSVCAHTSNYDDWKGAGCTVDTAAVRRGQGRGHH